MIHGRHTGYKGDMRDPQSPYRTAHNPDLMHIETITVFPNGARFFTGNSGLYWFGRISVGTRTDGIYLVRVFDDPRPIMLPFSPARYTTFDASCTRFLVSTSARSQRVCKGSPTKR